MAFGLGSLWTEDLIEYGTRDQQQDLALAVPPLEPHQRKRHGKEREVERTRKEHLACALQLEEVIGEDNPEKLRFVTSDSSKSIRRLMDFASGIIHGSQNTMDQSDIDLLLGD